MKTKTNAIDLSDERFVFTEVKAVDSKFRLNLGRKLIKFLSGILKVDGFQVFVGSSGDILLRPSTSIPSREAWLFRNKKASGLLKKGFEDIAAGKTTAVKDLDKFFSSL